MDTSASCKLTELKLTCNEPVALLNLFNDIGRAADPGRALGHLGFKSLLAKGRYDFVIAWVVCRVNAVGSGLQVPVQGTTGQVGGFGAVRVA